MFQTRCLLEVYSVTISGQTIWDINHQQTKMSSKEQEQKQSIVYVSQRRIHKRFLITQDSLGLYIPTAGSQAKQSKGGEEASDGPRTTSFKFITNDKKANDPSVNLHTNSHHHVNTVYISQGVFNQGHQNANSRTSSAMSLKEKHQREVDHTNKNITVKQSSSSDNANRNVNKLDGVVNVQQLRGERVYRSVVVSKKKCSKKMRRRRRMVKSPQYEDLEIDDAQV